MIITKSGPTCSSDQAAGSKAAPPKAAFPAEAEILERGGGGVRATGRWLIDHLRRRKWPLITFTTFLAVSLTYSFGWDPLIRHAPGWIIPGDTWSTFRAAHWVGWGALGSIYGPDTQLVTFPGIAVLLAPVAMISNGFGLSESIAPVFLTHPTSWFVLAPANSVLGASCLFAFDAMAEDLGVERRYRIALELMEAIVIFQVVVMWGHPEDLVALAFALYAMLAMSRQRWSLTGWLWGAAVVMQPLVLLMFPFAFVRTPRAQRFRLCLLAVIPSVVLVGTPLLSQWSATSAVLFRQANFQYLDHATPWIVLSPHLSRISVGAGPGRMLALIVAVSLAAFSARRKPNMVGVLWLCTLALSLRCFFEAVMVPFYVGPPLAMIVLVASFRNRWPRVIWAWVIGMTTSAFAFQRFSEWGYWAPLVVLLGAGLACAWPGAEAVGWVSRRPSRAGVSVGAEASGDEGDPPHPADLASAAGRKVDLVQTG